MNATTTWRTDDPCPVCGTGLYDTDDGASRIIQECRLCGWGGTWATGTPDKAADD